MIPRERGGAPRAFCVSIDVERDYRKDRDLSTRGIEEGLPVFVDQLNSRAIPYDLMISGEIVDRVPRDLSLNPDRCALGCHGHTHVPGYLNRLDPTTQETELRFATNAIASAFGRVPRVFRAPNFSANRDTIRILNRLGYHVDSSVLPGRRVRKWRVKTIVDHRGVPESPFRSDSSHYPKPGGEAILEVPVTANPFAAGSPLGLGFLNLVGAARFREALVRSNSKYIVFLAHAWEMVSWPEDAPVAPWVRSASRPPSTQVDALLSSLEGWSFVNLDQIARLEEERLGSPVCR